MTVISIINLKGGVAKTISAINIAYVLNALYGKRVLLIDNDKQGNTSGFFGLHSYDHPSLAELLTNRDIVIESVIRKTKYEGLNLIPANMNLLKANREILIDSERPQQTRLKKALGKVKYQYDYVVIDNAPDLNMTVINGLVACDEVLIPIKIDKYAFDGLDILCDRIEDLRDYNDNIRIAGCFITLFERTKVNQQGEDFLKNKPNIPMFKTTIRKTAKVVESTFAGEPMLVYAKNSTATKDYTALVMEYINNKNTN